jgi:hypothetical protein
MKSLLQKLVLLSLVTFALFSCCDCPQGEPNIIIEKEIGQEMINSYAANQHIYINAALDSLYPGGSPDFTDISYPIEELQKYLSKVKREANEMGYDEVGIRIHYAAKMINGVPKSTLVFSPIAPGDDVIIPGEGEDPNDPDTSDWEKIPGAIADMGELGNNGSI